MASIIETERYGSVNLDDLMNDGDPNVTIDWYANAKCETCQNPLNETERETARVNGFSECRPCFWQAAHEAEYESEMRAEMLAAELY